VNDAITDGADEAGSVESWSGKDRDAENFPVGSALIRPDLRRHVHAFYAFARNADDIADSPVLNPGDKLSRLDVMEAVLLGLRETGSPSALGLRASLAETGLSPIHSQNLLRAFRQDAEKSRYATWAELLDYCTYSAMPVGHHVLALHGEGPETLPPSDALCAVLQVLNHLQDVAKDLLALDRCYLPQDILTAAGATITDLRGPAETPALRRVFSHLLDECDMLTTTASALPGRVRDRRLRLETAVIVNLSLRLTQRLRVGDPIASRVKLRRSDVMMSLLGSLRHLPGTTR
jgi:farnesyl-diphosphate farnesyltransferase